jgi:hypothetical protein
MNARMDPTAHEPQQAQAQAQAQARDQPHLRLHSAIRSRQHYQPSALRTHTNTCYRDHNRDRVLNTYHSTHTHTHTHTYTPRLNSLIHQPPPVQPPALDFDARRASIFPCLAVRDRGTSPATHEKERVAMSGPPNGGGPARAMSVGNGPPSAGLPPHNAMPPQQGQPSSGASGPQSQQNLNQIVSDRSFPCFSALLRRQLYWCR